MISPKLSTAPPSIDLAAVEVTQANAGPAYHNASPEFAAASPPAQA